MNHRYRGAVLGALISLFLYPITSHAVVTVDPGATVVLKSTGMANPADGTDAGCTIFPITSITATCGTDQSGGQFGVRTTARGSFTRGQGSVLQFYDVEVAPDDGAETALLAQIAGSANFNGFLALVGGGRVQGGLQLKVLDLGRTGDPNPGAGKVVHKAALASHELEGMALTGVDFSIELEGGAPYIGFGGGSGLKFNIALKKKLVRDKLDFGTHVLLRRGHTYRIQFEAGTLAKKGAIPGLSIAQFMLGDDRAPDVIDPEKWLDGIDALLATDLPKIEPDAMNILRQNSDGVFTFFTRQRRLSGAPGFTDTIDLLETRAASAGLPTSFREIVQNRLKKSSAREEGIARPGAEVTELSVTLQTDQVEILKRHTELLNHIIELQNTPQGRRPQFPVK